MAGTGVLLAEDELLFVTSTAPKATAATATRAAAPRMTFERGVDADMVGAVLRRGGCL
jgi:hypothetical protein